MTTRLTKCTSIIFGIRLAWKGKGRTILLKGMAVLQNILFPNRMQLPTNPDIGRRSWLPIQTLLTGESSVGAAFYIWLAWPHIN